MTRRIFMMLCISGFIISFPANIIGCGPETDPYDYYLSFFNPDISASSNLRPFYYTGYNFLYDEEEPVNTFDEVAGEWAAYCGNAVAKNDVKEFVSNISQKDMSAFYNSIDKNSVQKIPDSIRREPMAKYFIASKDFEALGYLIYAKKAEPFVTGGYNDWDPIKRDSIVMAKLIKNGLQLYNAAKQDLFKLKYGYQVERLAHYSGNYADAIKFYDDDVAPNKTASVLQQMALSIKAGALWRTGKGKEAAYIFSKMFSDCPVKKISNYLSFKWAVDSKEDRSAYLDMCKDNKEKAGMLALFALGSVQDETETLNQIYKLDPENKMLETLAGREINKLEETYFTPALNKDPGGKLFYYDWSEASTDDSTIIIGAKKVAALTSLFVKIGKGTSSDPGLFTTAAAYGELMTRNFSKANEYLSDAKKMKLTDKVNDQWMLTNLLLSIDESPKMDVAEEQKILPSVKWLQQKALNDKGKNPGWSGNSEWKLFYRNIMGIAVAKKYHAQGDIYKEALATGAADKIFGDNSGNAIDFLHNNTDIRDVEKLFALMTEKKGNDFENFLLNNNSLKLSDVADFAGTAYLRNYDYAGAIKWLQKSTDKTSAIKKDPFVDILYDRNEAFSLKERTNKLAFAKEMLRLQQVAETDKINAAKSYYRMALGLYNITYYGHAWELVQYYRSGSDGYSIPQHATEFQKQYYGCFAAHDMFKKAMEASTDKNFKARCLFMMAKCAQKTIHKPQYEESGYSYDQYDARYNEYLPQFMNNKYFRQLKSDYGTTAFYKEALTGCSYLRDFVKKK